MVATEQNRFRNFTWKQFKKNKPAFFSLYVLTFIAVIALLAPLLANDRPLYVKYRGEKFFPAFSWNKLIEVKTDSGAEVINSTAVDWKQMKLDDVVWAPVVYSPGKSDYANSNFVSPRSEQKFLKDGKLISMPSRFCHWLGTGSRGDDLIAGLIHGARISLTIGFISMFIATLIGIIIGILAGYFGDDQLLISRGKLFAIMIGILIAWFYGFQIRSNMLAAGLHNQSGGFLFQLLMSILIFSAILILFFQLGKLMERLPWLNKTFLLPADTILSRVIEIFVSLPIFLLIITIAAISTPSLINVMIIIGLTNWTGIARLTRAEMLRIRKLEYIQSAQALGFTSWRIMLRHALPNAFAPALISISFGVANAILIESSLSFIGIGVPPTITTWGSLISEGRENLHAWWMIVFPGLCILITVLAYNLIGEGLRDALDPKLKN
ncbi:MAG TPA: ABC transporter permease [Chitinophagales bacterium]|nr:ABC transporter permease [Chitinophagales bacterium]